ncbi:hypothetical protein HPB51_024934 [Rhipicephalus microplus]|uniref:Uncharacterized protein n=1 Tax=Rhipicephalus microplus TaxID=6941 RepID=A0A9J6DDW3_RHIMP|nr:hypothetical protein HPB51_024934 [Rhipicephalus microplus]
MANKIRKRKKKTKKEPAPDFGENVEANAGGDCKNIALGKLDEDKEHLEEHAASTSPEDTFMSSYKHNGSDPEKYPAVSYGWGEDPLPEEPSQEDDDKPEDFGEFETKSRPMHNSGRSKSSPDIKRTDGHEANSLPSSTTTIPKKTCLEKSLKDLSRQTVALQRVQVLLEEQLTKAEKAVKAAFSEVHKVSDGSFSSTGFVLEQRQKLAAELKERSDTAPSLSEQSLAELRDDIKHFGTSMHLSSLPCRSGGGEHTGRIRVRRRRQRLAFHVGPRREARGAEHRGPTPQTIVRGSRHAQKRLAQLSPTTKACLLPGATAGATTLPTVVLKAN